MTDREYFRRLGIHAVEFKPQEPSGYILASWFLFWIVAGGGALYGALRLSQWALQALGVHLTGI
jgi:hypothetical protein